MVTWLTKIVNHVWSTEQIPEDWRKGIILPFWKRKGDALTCSNHRGITLLSIPGKTFARVVINRAIPAMHHHRRPHQAGIMPGRSTTDHISAIRLLAEKAREFRKGRALFIAFIDLKAAFDSVDRDCLRHPTQDCASTRATVHRHIQLCPHQQHSPTGSPSPAELDKVVWLPLICSTASSTTLWKMSVPWCQESS